jgi:hypothetical protein
MEWKVKGPSDNQKTQTAEAPLSVSEFAKRLGLKRASAYRILAHEPGVLRILAPGSRKPIVRVPVAVVDRIVRRATIPA